MCAHKVYCVSKDLESLMGKWCVDNELCGLPATYYKYLQKELRVDLAKCFDSNTKVWFPSPRHNSFKHLFRGCGAREEPKHEFWVALDPIFVQNPNFHLEVTRIFDSKGRWLGIGARPREGGPRNQRRQTPSSLEDVLKKFCLSGQNRAPKRLVIADDGTHRGASIKYALEKIRAVFGTDTALIGNLPEYEVRVGFCSLESFSTIGAYCNSSNWHAKPLRFWPGQVFPSSLVDWVCERDFYVGVPRSGQTIGKETKYGYPMPYKRAVGLPYLWGWGNIRAGASIEENQWEFSRRLTTRSIMLWKAIEKKNPNIGSLLVGHLPRFPRQLCYQEAGMDHLAQEKAVDYLECVAKSIFGSDALKGCNR